MEKAFIYPICPFCGHGHKTNLFKYGDEDGDITNVVCENSNCDKDFLCELQIRTIFRTWTEDKLNFEIESE